MNKEIKELEETKGRGRPKRIKIHPTNDMNSLTQKINYINQKLQSSLDLPVCIEVVHSGFWITDNSGVHKSTLDETCDRNSIMLTSESLLYVYKVALRHYLLSLHVISPCNIDPANLIPHIKVRDNKNDSFSKYKLMQNKRYIIDVNKLSARKDFLTIELDEVKDLHCTLIYSKKIGDKIDLIAAFKTIIRLLNSFPNLIDEYKKLDYFGQMNINYWYENSDKYPFNIQLPVDYVPPEEEDDNSFFDSLKLSAAGSILIN